MHNERYIPSNNGGEPVGLAFGKAILLGEHAVVLGAPALVVGLPDCMTARDGGPAETLSVSVEPWGLSIEADAKEDLGSRALSALDDALGEAGVPRTSRDRRVLVSAGVPPRAGLGSSAALAISVGRLVARLAGREDLLAPKKSAELVKGSETVFHGRPSGVDAAAAATGGVGAFARSLGLTPVEHPSTIHLLIASSGERPPAREMVQHVSRLAERTTAARRQLSQLGDLAIAGASLLIRSNLRGLGEAMNEAHSLLSKLGVSTKELDLLVEECRLGGAFGAKLTGAGGGGCVVALCPPDKAETMLCRLQKTASWARHFVIEGGGEVPGGSARRGRGSREDD